MKIYDIELPSVRYMVNRILEYANPVADTYGIPKIRYFLGYCIDSLLYKCSAQDYYLYRFYALNRYGKKQFLTLGQRMMYDKRNNSEEQSALVMDKEETLVRFAAYVNRDWCGQKHHNTSTDYELFAAAHARGIVKPLDDMGGAGIKIISTDFSDKGETLRDYCVRNHLMIEELIQQHADLNRMNPHAINTIRVLTNRGEVLGATLRIGVGGAELDNAHAGGIYAEIDLDTGVIISTAHKYTDERFIKHPDTGTIIPGFEIPCWSEVLTMVKSAAKLVDQMGLIGWDIAVTPEGPTIVEVNNWPGCELIQSPLGHGIRRKLKNK